MVTTTQVPKSFCPMCGAIFELATHPFEAEPSAGDGSLCYRCGCVMIFKEDLTLRLARRAERKAILREPVFRKMHEQIVSKRN